MSVVPFVTLPAGTLGVDFSFTDPSTATLTELRRQGKAFAVEYLSSPPSNPAKNLTAARRDRVWNAGIALGTVWETYETRPLGGAPAGRVDGQHAAQDVAALGAPPGHVILFASDMNVQAAQLPTVRAYGQAFADLVESVGYRMGVYGNSVIIRALAGRSVCNWLMVSRSFSEPDFQRHPLVNVWQRPHGTEPSWYDPNIVMKPTQFWFPLDVPDAPPPPPVIPSIPLTPSPLTEITLETSDMPLTAHPFRIRGYKEVVILPGFLWLSGPMLAAFGEAPTVIDDEPAARLAFTRAGCAELTPTENGQ